MALGPGHILRTEAGIDTDTLVDINGDGFLDRVTGPHRNTDCDGHTGRPHLFVWLSRGRDGWGASPRRCWMFPADHKSCDNHDGSSLTLRTQHVAPHHASSTSRSYLVSTKNLFVDFDGDGFVDLVRGARDVSFVSWRGSNPDPASVVTDTPWCRLSVGRPSPPLLWKRRSETGIEDEYVYTRLTSGSPAPLYGVSLVTHRNHNVPATTGTSQTSYHYDGKGSFDFDDRVFRGFAHTREVTDQAKTVHRWFHQSEHAFGIERRTEIYESPTARQPSRTEETHYVEVPLDGGRRRWVRPERVTVRTHDLSSGAAVATRVNELTYRDGAEESALGLLHRVKHVAGEDTRYDLYDHQVVDSATRYLVLPRSVSRLDGNYHERARTDYSYDGRGLLLQKTVMRGLGAPPARWTYTRDPTWGSALAETDPDGVTTAFAYHPEHRFLRSTTVGALTTRHGDYHFLAGSAQRTCGPTIEPGAPQPDACRRAVLDRWGRVTATYEPIDLPGGGFGQRLVERIEYFDHGGRPLSPPAVKVTRYPDSQRRPGEREITYTYHDGLGHVLERAASMPRGEWARHRFRFDAWGRLTGAWRSFVFYRPGPDPGDSATPDYRYTHDVLDRLVRIVGPDGITRTAEYHGDVTRITDGRGIRSEYVTNPHDEVIRYRHDLAGAQATTTFDYNALGKIDRVTTPTGEVYAYLHYADGTLHRSTLPHGVATTILRTPSGKPESVTRSSGAVVAYTYGTAGRLRTRTLAPSATACGDQASGRIEVFGYDCEPRLLGRLCEVQIGGQGHLEYDYDAAGNTTRRQFIPAGGSAALDHQYSYDALGRPIQHIHPSGLTVRPVYGPHGLPTAFESSSGQAFVWIGYNADLRPTHVGGDLGRLVPGMVGTFSRTLRYDPRSRLESITGAINRVAWNVGLTYDGNDNVTRLTDDLRETYRWYYDPENRLEQALGYAASGVYEHRFHYHPNGAIQDVVHPAAGGRTFSYRYGTAGRHRPDRIEDSGAPRIDLGWGADGELCTRTRPGRPPESYRWTADGMLSEIEVPAASRTTRIVYDHAGARLKTVEGASTTFHLDGTEAAPRGKVVETVRFPTGFCRIPAGNPGAARCHFTDGANVGAVTRGDGTGPSVITYSPFGQPTVIQGQRPGFGYGARRADAATGLVDFGARFYDPESRIFVRPDPLVVQGAPGWESLGLLTPYSYAANNPTSRIELDGRNWKTLKGYKLEWRQLQQAYGPHAGHVMGRNFVLDTVYQFVPGANYAHAVVTGKTYVEHRNNLEGSGRFIGALGLTAEVGLTLMTGGLGRAPKAPAQVRPPRPLKPVTVGADDAARPAAAVGTGGSAAKPAAPAVRVGGGVATRTFRASGSGTDLVRTTVANGTKVQVKSGHGYLRAHATGDLRHTGLSMERIENAIIDDIVQFQKAGGVYPQPGPGFTGPLQRTITVDGIDIGYRAVDTGQVVSVGTYFPI